MRYDLRTEPWIPIEDIAGEPRTVGLSEALLHADRMRDLRCGSPLETVAILRLLVAILHATPGVAPADTDEWEELWCAKRLPTDRLEAYLHGSACDGRFDLFSEDRPFMQIPRMTMAFAAPLAALAAELAAGNNATLFSHTADDAPPAFTPAEAARMLLAAQAFALGFGQGAEVNVAGAALRRPYRADGICLRGVTLFLSGDTLFGTLLLNLVPGRRQPEDQPAWERANPLELMDQVGKSGRLVRKALGPMDRYTWQSRMIRLLPDPDGMVRTTYITQGREADKAPGDPMKVFVANKQEGIYALPVKVGKATWRDLHAFLGFKTKAECQILAHAARQVRDGVLERGSHYRLNVVALATDPGKPGKFLLWQHDRMSLPPAVLANHDRVADIKTAIDDAEHVEREVWYRIRRVAARYLPPDGNPDPKDVDALSQSLDTRASYWAQLEARFAEFLERLPIDVDDALAFWRTEAARAGSAALETACRNLGESARAIKAVAGITFGINPNSAEVKAAREAARKQKGGKTT